LNFTDEEATEYTKLFLVNEIEMSMIPELSDGTLKGVGIEKGGQ
jgi:hypothetical protein